jgi:hypothetical protein
MVAKRIFRQRQPYEYAFMAKILNWELKDFWLISSKSFILHQPPVAILAVKAT